MASSFFWPEYTFNTFSVV